MGSSTGSTIQARQDLGQNLFAIIIVVMLIVIFIICIYFISRAITKYHNSPEYIEKQKNRPTSLKDIKTVAAACSLTKEEKDVLSVFCHKNKALNILYLVKNTESFDSLLKALFKEYDLISDEVSKQNLFSMRKKVLAFYTQKIVVKNTKFIKQGTSFIYTKEKGFHYRLILTENAVDGMIITIPNELDIKTDFPKPLEKILLVFDGPDGSPYTVETRIVRFQDGKDKKKQMIAVHTDKISNLQKRAQERVDTDSPCKFNSVKISSDKKGKAGAPVYIPSEKDYDGELEDVSAGGCKLSTDLPIKAGQYINIKAPFDKKQLDSAIGIILRTTKRSDNVFVLHIKFLKIDLAVVNRINAMIIHYDD